MCSKYLDRHDLCKTSSRLRQHWAIIQENLSNFLPEIKIKSKGSGLFMIGGGVPKNFIQDTVICAELLGKEVNRPTGRQTDSPTDRQADRPTG